MFQKSYRQKSWAVVIMAVEAVEGKDSNIVVLCTFPALMTPPPGHQAGVGNEAALDQNYGRCEGQLQLGQPQGGESNWRPFT